MRRFGPSPNYPWHSQPRQSLRFKASWWTRSTRRLYLFPKTHRVKHKISTLSRFLSLPSERRNLARTYWYVLILYKDCFSNLAPNSRYFCDAVNSRFIRRFPRNPVWSQYRRHGPAHSLSSSSRRSRERSSSSFRRSRKLLPLLSTGASRASSFHS